MAITYDVPSNTITVTGYTQGTPCTFLDIWNADQAGGWGVVSKQGTSQFLFDCRLVIGDGSTPSWFADKDVQIVFSDGIRTANYQALIERKANAYIILGELINEARKSTGRGVSLINLEDTFYHYIILDSVGTGYTYLYSCSFYTHIYDRIVLQNARVWNGIFSGSASLKGGTFWVTNTDMFNVYITRGFESIRSIDAISTFNTITIMDSYRIALYGTSAIGATLRNVYVRNLSQWQLDARYDFYIVNADSDSWTIEWLYTGSGKTYRQYEFDAHCQDKDGNDLSGVEAVAEYIDASEAFSVLTDEILNGYFRSDQHTINTITAYKFLFTNSLTPVTKSGTASGSQVVTWGMRVWKVASGGGLTEITSGTPVAQVSRGSDGEGIQSNTWNCPETALETSDALLIRIYDKYGLGSWNQRAEFITEQLSAKLLPAETWTVYYHTFRLFIGVVNTTLGSFNFGHSVVPSRIETSKTGDIATQTVTHGTFDQANGSIEQLKTPLKVTYSKAGYQTVIKYYDLEEKTKDVVVLQRAIDLIFVDGKVALNLDEENPESELYTGL